MENRLSDVHNIANELLRRGEIGADNADTEGARIVRVERHAAARGPAIMPAAVPFGLDEEMRKVNAQLEAIRRSVEFTEAHMAVDRSMAKAPEDALHPARPARRGWTVSFLAAGNLILLALLVAEIHDGRVGATALALYRAAVSTVFG
jgi:hypothetical protein